MLKYALNCLHLDEVQSFIALAKNKFTKFSYIENNWKKLQLKKH